MAIELKRECPDTKMDDWGIVRGETDRPNEK
jgi:hypothetical protein